LIAFRVQRGEPGVRRLEAGGDAPVIPRDRFGLVLVPLAGRGAQGLEHFFGQAVFSRPG